MSLQFSVHHLEPTHLPIFYSLVYFPQAWACGKLKKAVTPGLKESASSVQSHVEKLGHSRSVFSQEKA